MALTIEQSDRGFDPTHPTVGRFVVAAGLRTFYHDIGEGAPLVLLHGSGPGVSAWENWAGVLPLLASRCRVIAVDVPGFGRSEGRPDDSYDMEFWVNHLFAFMNAIEVDRASIVGNSFGGMLGMAAAVRDSHRVDRLILMGSAAGDIPLSEAHRLGARYDGSRGALEEILRMFPFDPSVLTTEMVDRRHEASIRHGRDKAAHKLRTERTDTGELVFKGTAESELATITTPTLILHGRDDRILPVDLALRVHRAIPTSEMHIFGNCGHWVQIERRDEFVRQILGFVGAGR